MSFILNSKIANAVKDYTLTDEVSCVPVSFSGEFEEKMERFIKRKQRSRKIHLISQRVALAVLTIALAGSWLYLMALPRNEDGLESLPASQQGGLNPGQEQPPDTPQDTPGDGTVLLGPPPEPTGMLVIRNDEVDMGHDSALRQGINSWDEARSLVGFDLLEPAVLPEGTELFIIEFMQSGENGSYPCAAALFTVPFGDRSHISLGYLHLYYFQYYLGAGGSIELLEESEWIQSSPGGNRLISMKAEPAEVVWVGGAEVLFYTFSLGSADTRYHIGSETEFFVLHWVQNDVLFRIVAPIVSVAEVVSLSREDLLAIAESVITGNG